MALFERVQRLHRHNMRRGFHSAEIWVSDAIYAKCASEFRHAFFGWMLIGLPVKPANVPGVAVTRGRRCVPPDAYRTLEGRSEA